MFDLSLPAVAEHDELFDEFDRVDLIAGAHLDRVDGGMRVDSLDQRRAEATTSDGGWSDVSRSSTARRCPIVSTPGWRAQTAASPGRNAAPCRRPGSPQHRRRDARLRLRRGSDQHRATIRRRNKAGDHEGPTRVGDGDHRLRRPRAASIEGSSLSWSSRSPSGGTERGELTGQLLADWGWVSGCSGSSPPRYR